MLKRREALARRRCRWRTLASGAFETPECSHILHCTDLKSFAEKLLKAAKGEKGIVEPTYVYLPGVPGGEAVAKETGVDFFSVPVQLGVSRVSVVP